MTGSCVSYSHPVPFSCEIKPRSEEAAALIMRAAARGHHEQD